MLILQGRMFKSLPLLLWLLFVVVQGSEHRCCKGDASYKNNTSNCSDDSRIQLYCIKGYYMLEPNEKFIVYETENSSLLSFGNDDDDLLMYNVSHNSYCTAKVMDNPEGPDVALICFPEDERSNPPEWRLVFFGLCTMISSVFFALTLFVYLILPEMREIQDKAVMSMTGSFMIAFFLMGQQQLGSPPEGNIACLFVAFLMYYAYMCAFFWLNVISFNIFRSVWFTRFKPHSDILFAIYCMAGWGLPLCFLATSLIAHHVEGYHLKPGFVESSCWFNGPSAMWTYFYGPILVLLLINLIYLGLTSWKLWNQWRELDCCKLKVLRFKCTMYVKLALLMGFTWIFEVLSFAFGDSGQIYWLLPDLVNVMQGFFVFILFVVSRKRVRKLLAKRRPFDIPFPKSWAAYADEENCEQVGPEELELSHE